MVQELAIDHDFQGRPLPQAQRARLRLARSGEVLLIDVDAPFFGDPPPAAPVGPTDRLWEHEVCEIFIADAADHYVEVELSPHGHHLVLELAGVRRVVRSKLPIAYDASLELFVTPPASGPIGRFRGSARVPWSYLPVPPLRGNAYAIHGPAERRCYHAHRPPGGAVADFHQLERFVSLQLGGPPAAPTSDH